ncbi:hypothetical protein [Marinobacter xestospongiae]|uniref:Uncharacterized protein n=1 Tax=Marinobacter xestospongiae TaxID=994319 RepID=A0ABU3W014_9GAMM|nr:hypothetical protein [Marinobacter xestospongiae]MDV2079889.1 hypothetical protein [Marinobacter xestospongiae]
MKTALIVTNTLLLLLSLLSFLSGSVGSVFLALAYALTLGSIAGTQKRAFHILAIIANSFYLLLGLGLLISFHIRGLAANEPGGAIFLTIIVVLSLLLVPSLNVRHIIKEKLSKQPETSDHKQWRKA